jgi:hypothetical protein
MGKKCIPGIICIENMTLFILVIILLVVVYIVWVEPPSVVIMQQPGAHSFSTAMPTGLSSLTANASITQIGPLQSLATRGNAGDVFSNPYVEPSKVDGIYYPPVLQGRISGDVRGVPINIQTRSTGLDYQQVGILTKSGGSDLILPLFGRKIMTGRDKWQYYAISNTGSLNTKLPVSVNGKSCTGELGCDSISNGDTIYVEGYKDIFKVTLYENTLFNYLPF